MLNVSKTQVVLEVGLRLIQCTGCKQVVQATCTTCIQVVQAVNSVAISHCGSQVALGIRQSLSDKATTDWLPTKVQRFLNVMAT